MQKIYYKIYKITNLITKELYIGQTIQTLKKRFSQHCSKSSKCFYLKKAINLYGKENFKIEQIDQTEILYEAKTLEGEYINNLNTLYPNGYNGIKNGVVLCESSRNKISIKLTGKSVPIEVRNKISISHTGKTLDIEHRKNISNSLKNKPKTQEHIEKVSKANTGKKRTKEQNIINSESHKNKTWNESQRNLMSEKFSGKGNPFYNKHHTKESIQKIRDKKLGKNLKFDSKIEQEIINLYLNHKKITHIAKLFKTSKPTIYRILRRHNIILN